MNDMAIQQDEEEEDDEQCNALDMIDQFGNVDRPYDHRRDSIFKGSVLETNFEDEDMMNMGGVTQNAVKTAFESPKSSQSKPQMKVTQIDTSLQQK